MKIVVWTPFIDHLFSETWLNVQSILSEKPTFVLNSAGSLVRKAQGWDPVPLDEFQVIMLEKGSWSRRGREIIRANPDAIHVFWSFWGPSGFLRLILYALSRGRKVAVVNEPYSISPVGYAREESIILSLLKVWFRPILYRVYAMALALFRGPIPPCILPLSLIARDQFLRAGFGVDSLFPFGYFVPRTASNPVIRNGRDSQLRLVFMGALLKRKGLDIAVEAVNILNQRGLSVMLDVYGSGDAERFIPKNSSWIAFRGRLRREDVQPVMAQYDALILPSRHDGWGAVVNESLLQGVPVIVSDRVGAKCLLETTGAGTIFQSENVSDLVLKLEELCTQPSMLADLRVRALQAGERILPKVAAQYLVDVFKFHFIDAQSGRRPYATWCGTGSQ